MRPVALITVGLFLFSTAEARIKRSQTAKVEFKLEQPCPANGATKGLEKGG